MITLGAMTPAQQGLLLMMRELSEDYWCAGWLAGLERSLWEDIQKIHDPASGFWSEEYGGPLETYQHHLKRIAAAAAEAGGWIVWDDANTGEVFLDWDEWGARLRLDGPAELPGEFLVHHRQDSYVRLLASLSKDKIVHVVGQLGFCYPHFKNRLESKEQSGCPVCIMNEVHHERQELAGCKEDEQDLPYDIDIDPEGILSRS